MRKLFIVTALLTLFGLSSSVRAEEGMWLFSSPPAQEVKTKYGFELTPKFLEHLQKSSIRFSNGGSASFVSSNGLIMTNHHIAESSLNKLSTPEKNLLENGFYAATLEEELKCPELELRVLLKIADATQQINSAVKPEMTSTEAEEARRAAMNKIEQEMSKSTGNKCEIVSFYHGAFYHLYQYKILTDVRLVFAPESSVGFFGGEPDNFEYPRYNLDVSFFRAYENDKPYKP
ncbi:MAG: S46 family peptidase, partial [Thermoguttaceae bacterium]|nr:S46 family peptidase [Thermoguttaceae bacterium]